MTYNPDLTSFECNIRSSQVFSDVEYKLLLKECPHLTHITMYENRVNMIDSNSLLSIFQTPNILTHLKFHHHRAILDTSLVMKIITANPQLLEVNCDSCDNVDGQELRAWLKDTRKKSDVKLKFIFKEARYVYLANLG